MSPRIDLAPPAAPAVRIVEVLPDAWAQYVFDVACAYEPRFHASTGAVGSARAGLASAAVPEHRVSSVLDDCPEVFPWFHDVVRGLVPAACAALLVPPFFPSDIEMQMTAHGDGAFFRPHTDNGTYRLHRRALSYVYCFGRRDTPYVGGELSFHDPVGAVSLVAPAPNSIVFFTSGSLHEVRPVAGPTAFRDSRFTVNGWLTR